MGKTCSWLLKMLCLVKNERTDLEYGSTACVLSLMSTKTHSSVRDSRWNYAPSNIAQCHNTRAKF